MTRLAHCWLSLARLHRSLIPFRSALVRMPVCLCFISTSPPQGQKEFLMRAHFGLPSVSSEDHMGVSANAKAPISVQFEIPYFTVSGIQVRYLKVRLRTHAPHAERRRRTPCDGTALAT